MHAVYPTRQPIASTYTDFFSTLLMSAAVRRLSLSAATAGLGAAFLLGGCGDNDATATAGALSPTTSIELVEAEREILAIDNVFDPEDEAVPAGTTITFTNAGRNDHNVIPEDPGAEWVVPAEDFGPTDSASFRFTEPGTYRYYCSIHGTIDVGMVGSITVTAPGG